MTHAAGESVKETVPPCTHAVVLSVESEDQLRKLSNTLEKQGVKHILIEEVDEPYTGQATAIGIEPTSDRTLIRRFTSSLPLLRD